MNRCYTVIRRHLIPGIALALLVGFVICHLHRQTAGYRHNVSYASILASISDAPTDLDAANAAVRLMECTSDEIHANEESISRLMECNNDAVAYWAAAALTKIDSPSKNTVETAKRRLEQILADGVSLSGPAIEEPFEVIVGRADR